MIEPIPPSGPAIKPASEPALSATPQRPERREHPRFKLEGATAVLGKAGFLSKLGLSQRKDAVVNLSQGGVLVLVGKPLPVGTRLPIRIEIANPADVVEGEAVVRWCAQSARNDAHFYAGLSFEGLDPLARKKIAKMHEWFTSSEYRAKASARKDASSGKLKPVRP
ncbi:MAG TPA: PilZ domain-containing protein [Planctomycetota bacterium]|nr:PilZ domain-containing protein [Planctomycetota bacterium]